MSYTYLNNFSLMRWYHISLNECEVYLVKPNECDVYLVKPNEGTCGQSPYNKLQNTRCHSHALFLHKVCNRQLQTTMRYSQKLYLVFVKAFTSVGVDALNITTLTSQT